MKVVAIIKDTRSSIVVEYFEPWEYEDGDEITADGRAIRMWGEGSFSCDCNRGDFFDEAFGGEPEGGDRPCGRVRFSVLGMIEADTGRVICGSDPRDH